jgi:hypothetical protein
MTSKQPMYLYMAQPKKRVLELDNNGTCIVNVVDFQCLVGVVGTSF